MDNTKPKVIFLCTQGISTRIIFNGIKSDIDILAIVVESKQSLKDLLKKRLKKLGIATVFGQILFMLLNKVLIFLAKNDINTLFLKLNIDTSELPSQKIISVTNINEDVVENILKNQKPDLVIVNGTRIISKNILSSIKAPFINTHMGITPRYRGVHGGYWALVENDLAHCGVTVHLVDTGIDTGGILYQENIEVNKSDSFNTYPILQAHKAIKLLKLALLDIKKNQLNTISTDLNSKLWYHPTLWTYLKNWVLKGVK